MYFYIDVNSRICLFEYIVYFLCNRVLFLLSSLFYILFRGLLQYFLAAVGFMSDWKQKLFKANAETQQRSQRRHQLIYGVIECLPAKIFFCFT